MNTTKLALTCALLVAACDTFPLEAYPAPSVFFDRMPRCRELEGRSVPLQKAHLTIPLAGGLASNVDPKQLPIGGNLELQNTRAGRVGEVVPRAGTTALSTGLLGTSDTLPAPWSLATWKDCLVSLSGSGVDHPLNMYSPNAGQWATDRQATLSTAGIVKTLERGPVFAAPNRISGAGSDGDIAYSAGYLFVIYQSAPTAGAAITVHEVVVDATTGERILEKEYADGLTTVRSLGVRVVNGYVVFVRTTTASDLAFDYWQISNLDGVQSSLTHATTAAPANSYTFDVLVKDATTLSVAFSDGVNAQAVDFVPSTATLTAWTPKDATAANIPVDQALNWMQDFGASGKIALITSSAAQGVRVQWNIPTAGATRQAATTNTIDAAATDGAVTGHTQTSSATGTFMVFYNQTAAAPVPPTTIKYGGYVAGLAGAAGTFARSVHACSKTWTYGGNYYLLTQSLSFGQGSRFVLPIIGSSPNATTVPLAIAQVRSAQTGGRLSAVVSPSAGVWTASTTVQTRFVGQPVAYSPSNIGIETLAVSFVAAGNTTYGTPREAIDSLLVPGGTLNLFDGTTYAEAGFAYFPDQPVLTPGAGGAMTAGATYYYASVFAWPDASGRIHRSAPSLTTSVAMGASTKVSIEQGTLRITGRTGVVIEFYRGAANSNTPLQLVGAIANDTTVSSVTFVDTVADTVQANGEFLYTTGGGALPNDTIPGFTSIAVAGNRLFGVSADDSQAILPSAPFIPGTGLRFSEQTKIIIRDQHGAIYGVAAQPNGTVLVFKKSAVYLISGGGPDQAGRGSFNVSIVAIGLGTTNPRSIVETSLGAEFLSTSSRTGWYRINLGQAPEYIGGPVESYVGQTIVGAIMIAGLSETRYYMAAGGCLVHDLKTGMWSVDTGSAATAATAWGTFGAYGTSTPSVIVDNPVVWSDPATPGGYTMKATTPWVKLGDLRGYERMYRARGVGELAATENSGADMTIALQKDLIPTDVVSQIASSDTSAAPGRTWNWEMRYSAKFEAVRFVVSCLPNNFDFPDSVKWSAIVLEYGVKPGLRPIASGNRTA